MNIDHLKIFINLTETLNFSQTAKTMNISQSAVSQAIKSIENELGFDLFKRTKRQVNLTKGGEAFSKRMTIMLSNFDKAVIDSREISQRERSALTIGTTGTTFEAHLLPLIIKDFRLNYPDVKIYLEYFSHNQLKQHLLNQECDLIFTTIDDIQAEKAFNFTPLVTGYFCALVPKTNPLSHQPRLTLSDFEHQNLILLNDDWCPPQQLKLQTTIKTTCTTLETTYVDNVAVANTMVEAGLGITVMPNFINCSSKNLFTAIPLDYHVTLAYGTATLIPTPTTTTARFIKQLAAFDGWSK